MKRTNSAALICFVLATVTPWSASRAQLCPPCDYVCSNPPYFTVKDSFWPYYWTKKSFTVADDSNYPVPPTGFLPYAHLAAAMNAWMQGTGVSLSSGGMSPDIPIVWVSDSAHEPPGGWEQIQDRYGVYHNAVAQTEPETEPGSNVLENAVIWVNLENYNDADWNDEDAANCPSTNELDLTTALVHELGHCLGRGDIDQADGCSVMEDRMGKGDCRRAITTMDVMSMHCRYDPCPTTWGKIKSLYDGDTFFDRTVALSGQANTVVWKRFPISSGASYSVYRSEGNSDDVQFLGSVDAADSVFVDTATEFGKRYTYRVGTANNNALTELGSPSAGLKLLSDYIFSDTPFVADGAYQNTSNLAVYGTRLYAAFYETGGVSQIRTFDTSDPLHITELGRHTGIQSFQIMSLNEDGTRLYVKTSTAFLVLDATQPSLPLMDQVSVGSSSELQADMAVAGDVVYLACGTPGIKAIDVAVPSQISVVGTYHPSNTSFTSVQAMGSYVYASFVSLSSNESRCDRLIATKYHSSGHVYDVEFDVDCSSNSAACFSGFSAGSGLVRRPGSGSLALERTPTESIPYRLVNMLDPQHPMLTRLVDAPASGPVMILRDQSTGEPLGTLKLFSTFESIDFDSRFAYATTPLFQDPYDRELVVFDLWDSGSNLLYATGDRLGYGGTATVRSQGKYVYLLDTFYENGELHSNKARLRVYEKASGGQPDPEHPVRVVPPSDAYKLGQNVGVFLAVGCPTSVHVELLEDGNVVSQVSTQNFAVADDVARSALWAVSSSATHLENHSYALRATATYADNSTSAFLSTPFRIEIGAKREVAIGGGKPFTSIQAAVDASASGDTVVVYPGNYTEALTLNSNVRVIGKAGASMVAGTSAPAMSVSGVVFPPIVDGLEFHAATGATNSAISVTGCGITVKNCTFNGFATRAVSVSSGHAAFANCTFANNSDAAGFGAAVWLDADAVQATTFTDCQFTNNTASVRGGAVYLGSTGSYSATAPQTSFVRCSFVGNTASEGAAVRVGVNRRPSFDHCVFANNHPTATTGGSIVGGAGGVSATLQNCTFASNSASQSFDVIRLEPGGTVPLPTVDASIFANTTNGNAFGSSYGGTYAAKNSDFVGNSSGDATWSVSGSGNFSENPAFCPGTDYTIYAFSPCVPGVKYASLIGAKDVACVPNATVVVQPGGSNPPDNYLLVCPRGDGDTLAVQVTLDPTVMTRAPQARELTIQSPYSSQSIWSNKTITSDISAQSPSYVMRIGHKYLSGYTWLHLPIYLNGHPLAQQAVIKRRSPDITSAGSSVQSPIPDGKVRLEDYSRWCYGYSYPGHEVPYDSLSDLNANGQVTLADFGMFCYHYGPNAGGEHDQPFSLPSLYLTSSSQVAASAANVTMQFTEEYVTSTDRHLNVDLALDEATGATACIFAVKTNRDDLRFLDWEKSNPNVLFADVKVDSVEQLYVGTAYPSAYTKSKESLGRMVFDIDGNAPINIGDDQFILTVGDIELMGMDNQTYGAQLSGVMGRTIKGSVQKLFHNRLEQNFPNPFNPQTTIAFSIQKASNVHLGIYDVTGGRVRDLVDEKRVPGAYRVVWDGRSQNGNPVASGVYFYKLTAGEFTSAKKMVLLK